MKRLLFGVALVVSPASYAGLIDNDDLMANTFYDTDTNLVWLDTRMTGYSNYYSSSYSSGSTGRSYTIEENLSRFSDFRIATETEVRTLMDNAFTSLAFDSDGNYSYYDSWSNSSGSERSQQDPLFISDFNRLISVADGITSSSSRSYRDGDSSGSSAIDGLYISATSEYGSLSATYSYDNNYSTNSFGNRYLRSESDRSSISFSDITSVIDPEVNRNRLWMVYEPVGVSEPATLGLLILGLLSLRSRRTLPNG